jgi:hypothetical protein
VAEESLFVERDTAVAGKVFLELRQLWPVADDAGDPWIVLG